MAEEKPEPQESIAPPENGAEPDYTGLEEYIIYPPHPDRPPRWETPGVKAFPQEPGKLSVEEFLERLRQLPQPPEVDWDSTEVIRRMRDAR